MRTGRMTGTKKWTERHDRKERQKNNKVSRAHSFNAGAAAAAYFSY